MGKCIRRENGITHLLGASRISYGLYPGSPDNIGWKSLIIQPKHVGRRLAVFVGLEFKSPRGVATDQQKHFLERLKRDGAIAGIVRDLPEAIELVHQFD